MASPGRSTRTATGSSGRTPSARPRSASSSPGSAASPEVGRALDEAGIGWLGTSSAQAKGRVERLWGTWQDRLLVELRLETITTIDDANAFLPRFIRRHNARFAVPAADPAPAWRSFPAGRSPPRASSASAMPGASGGTPRSAGAAKRSPCPAGATDAAGRVAASPSKSGSTARSGHATRDSTTGSPRRLLRLRSCGPATSRARPTSRWICHPWPSHPRRHRPPPGPRRDVRVAIIPGAVAGPPIGDKVAGRKVDRIAGRRQGHPVGL